jgi:uncharacterized repeat protein (TIGR02543 family)
MYKTLLKLLIMLSVALFINSCGDDSSGGGSGGGGGNAMFTVSFFDGADIYMEQIQISAGAEITIPDSPRRQGYSFAGWLVNNTGDPILSGKYAVNADLALFASWTPQGSYSPIYTVVFYNGSERILIEQGLMDAEIDLSRPANIPNDYDFKGWLVNNGGEPLPVPGKYTVRGSALLFASYEPKSSATPALYTAAFYDNGALIEFMTAEGGEKITLPDYYKPDLTLRGWREGDLSGYLKQPSSEYTVGYDVNFYASWALPTVTLRFFNGQTLLKTITVPKGRKVGLPLKDDFPELADISGKSFISWRSGGKDYAGIITVNGSMDFNAVWQDIDLATIRYFIRGEPAGSVTVEKGDIITFPRIADFLTAQSNPVISGGYTFTGWCNNNDERYCYAEEFSGPLNGNRDYHARWSHTDASKKVTARYYADTVPAGSTEEFPVNALTLPTMGDFKEYDRTLWNHYIFNGWRMDDENIVNNFVSIDADTALHGDFTLRDFTEIKNDTDLRNIKDNLNGRYRLMNDIYIQDGGWTPIGGEFKGVLEGAGHRIENLKISGVDAGLFNAIGGNYLGASAARITDLTIMLANDGINGTSRAGGLAGSIIGDDYSWDKLKIINVHIKKSRSGGGRISSGAKAGGIIGEIDNRDNVYIIASSNAADISSAKYTGGLIGNVYSSDDCFIFNSYNTGTVIANNSADDSYVYAGGIAGNSSDNTRAFYIESSHNSGLVRAVSKGGARAGGISGYSSVFIVKSYNTGRIEASGGSNNTYAGGLAGHYLGFYGSDAIWSYNSGDVYANASSNNAYAGGIAGTNTNELSNSYNTGFVSAIAGSGYTAYAGGIAGTQAGVERTKTNFTYNTGNISASGRNVYAGGIVGYLESYGTGIQYNAAINTRIDANGNGTLKANRILGGASGTPSKTSDNLARHPMPIYSDYNVSSESDKIFRGENTADYAFGQRQTYTAIGWKFCDNYTPCSDDNPWKMSNGNPYPILYWQ